MTTSSTAPMTIATVGSTPRTLPRSPALGRDSLRFSIVTFGAGCGAGDRVSGGVGCGAAPLSVAPGAGCCVPSCWAGGAGGAPVCAWTSTAKQPRTSAKPSSGTTSSTRYLFFIAPPWFLREFIDVRRASIVGKAPFDRGSNAYATRWAKIRRSRTGLIAHDPARAQPGYTLFAPMYGDGTVYLLNMDGKVEHTWRLPYRPGLYGHLLPNGHLFYGGKIMEDLDRCEAWPRCKGGAVLEVDWSGKILWEVRHPDHHHDARRLRNGNVLLLCLCPLPADLARRVQGGLPGTEANGTMYADYLVEMTTGGRIVWEWRSWEHLDPAAYPMTFQDRRAEWTHGNTVAETADGNIGVRFRKLSPVVRT